MNRFMELHDSYELYEFSRQYYLDIDPHFIKTLKFPIAVYFDENGKPSFKSASNEPKNFRIKFENRGDTYYFESNSVEEIVDFVREKAKRRPKPGDKIVIKDADSVMLENFEFFRDNFIDYEYACRYDFGNTPNTSFEYDVIVGCGEILLVQNRADEKCYLVREEGVEIKKC